MTITPMMTEMTVTSNSAETPRLEDNPVFPGIDPTKLYSTKELSALTGMTVSFFEAARSRGGGPDYIIVGKRVVRHTGKSVIEWLLRGHRQDRGNGGDNA